LNVKLKEKFYLTSSNKPGGQTRMSVLLIIYHYLDFFKMNSNCYSKYSYVIKYSIFLLALLFAVKCSENNITSNDSYPPLSFFKEAVVPDTLYTVTSEDFLVQVKTEKSLYSNISYILMKVFNTSYELPSSIDTLYDNAYLGDIVPGDGIFSRIINSTQIKSNAEKCILEFSNPLVNEILLDTILFVEGEKNLPPVISNLILPNTISLDSTELKYYIFLDVVDPQGKDDIKEVKGKVYYPYFSVPSLTITLKHYGIPPEIIKGENNYVYIFQTNDMAKMGIGEYSILFYAQDNKGNLSNSLVGSIYFYSEVENLPPVIEYVNAPDTVETTVKTILIEAMVTDVNGIGDIEVVYFNSYLPDGNPATGNPFYMFDDGSELSLPWGISGDKIKGDGIYSCEVIAENPAIGNYLFKFYAVDRVKNVSEPVEHTIVVR